jgi:glycosyltransferase involved in cell wall biosynthesis
MTHLRDFFDDIEAQGEIDTYLARARGLAKHVTFVGLVDHGPLSAAWPLAATSLVPSISAEAFGMVSAEAAACGAPPIVSHHSGLADVAEAIQARYPESARDFVSFDSEGRTAVRDLADRIIRICNAPAELHAELAAAARRTVEEEWSWDSIAESVADLFVPAHADHA